MKLALYKAGQGYWVRVMTASMIGVVILAATAWVWTQLGTVPLPQPTWVLTLNPVTGTVGPDQVVEFLAEPSTTGEDVVSGTGTVVVAEALPGGGVRVTLKQLHMGKGHEPSTIQGVRLKDAGAASVFSGAVTGREGVPIFQPIYLQAGGVSVVLLVGAVLCYWMVGANPGTAEFLIATDGEMKKVNWSSRKDILGSTWVVVAWSLILAGGLFAVDQAFAFFFGLIGVLQQ